MREFQNINSSNESTVRHSLALLANKATASDVYRNAFECLGIELGRCIKEAVREIPSDEIMLVCASEDADWLGKGVETGLGKVSLPLSVFWNSRSVLYDKEGEKIEISPIVKSYEEEIDNCRVLVIIKSIISSSCVVKTQLTRLLGKLHPTQVIIAAPVMYKDGPLNLMKEFPEDIAKVFQFVAFAIDDDRSESGEVLPGIGGMVYPRLGLGDISEKNSYIPDAVLMRM